MAFTFYWSLALLGFYIIIMNLLTNLLSLSIENGILILYGIFIILFAIPSLPGQETKNSFLKLVKQCFIPGTVITFPEVLFADALCSLSKVMKCIETCTSKYNISLYNSVSDLYYIGIQGLRCDNYRDICAIERQGYRVLSRCGHGACGISG